MPGPRIELPAPPQGDPVIRPPPAATGWGARGGPARPNLWLHMERRIQVDPQIWFMRHEVPEVGQEVRFVGVSASRTTQGFTNFHFKYLTVFGGEYHWHILSPHRFPGFDPSGVWAPVVSRDVANPEPPPQDRDWGRSGLPFRGFRRP